MYSSIDTLWVLLGTVLVFFMQAGFTMVETGFTRAKNAGNIIMKNVMDFSLGSLVYWIIGFGIMFGAGNKFFGLFDFLVQSNYDSSIPTNAFLMFQTVFCATAATIVSGAVAERTKFSSYLIISIVLSGIIYPISGHWIWGGGWLSELGFHDFAGSTAVHLVGGVGAFLGAKFVGPRIGKYGADGEVHAIPGHHLTLGALGVFILWFSWFGFNAGSTLSLSSDEFILSASHIFVTTNLSAVTSAVATMFITWIRYKKPDVSLTLNGILVGLVAITAGCDVVSPLGAVIIGLLASIVMVFGIEFIDQKLKVDDPVGAVGVHFLGGAIGTILTGFFAVNQGLFYGGGFTFLIIQCLGVLATTLWTGITLSVLFFLLKKTIGLRVSEEEEISGLDLEEHGIANSYADFMMNDSYPTISNTPDTPSISLSNLPSNTTISQLSLVIRPQQFDKLKHALTEIGVSGMTVTHVLGCGMQKGHHDYYRGAPVETSLNPKLKVDIVVCKVPVETVINVAKRVLYTGEVGDGKVFVSPITDVTKIRTGETGYDALQDDH